MGWDGDVAKLRWSSAWRWERALARNVNRQCNVVLHFPPSVSSQHFRKMSGLSIHKAALEGELALSAGHIASLVASP